MSSSPFVDAPPNDWDIPDDIGLKKKKKTPQEKAKAREERAKKEQIKKQQATIKQPISFLGNITVPLALKQVIQTQQDIT